MFCTECGRSVPDEMRFCLECGTRVEAVPISPARPPSARPIQRLHFPKARLFVPAGAVVAVVVVLAVVLAGSSPFVGSATLRDFVGDIDRGALTNASGEIEEGWRAYVRANGFVSSPFPRSASGCHFIMVLAIPSENPGIDKPTSPLIEFSASSLVGTTLRFRNPQTGEFMENTMPRPEGLYDVVRAKNIKFVNIAEGRNSEWQPLLRDEGCKPPS